MAEAAKTSIALCAVDDCCRPRNTKGLCKMHYLRVWKHGSPHARKSRANGEGGVSSQGYKMISTGGRRVAEHVHLAQTAIGKDLPKGVEVHHVNGDKTDNRPNNLVICQDGRYHQLLHARQRSFEATGNPDLVQCRYCDGWGTRNEIKIYDGTHKGHHSHCRQSIRRQNRNG